MRYLPELEAILKSTGSAALAAKVLALAKPGMLLQKRYETVLTERAPLLGLFKRRPKPTRRGLTAAPRTSRLGGLPELAPGQPWPTCEGKPLQFLAQINCAELGQYRDVTLLPGEGILQFFHAEDGMECSVTFTPGDAALVRATAPGGTTSPGFVLPEFPVEFAPVPSFPHAETKEFDALGLSEEDAEVVFNAYGEIVETIRREHHAYHQMGGYPEAIQGHVFTECEKDSGRPDLTWAQAAENAHRWKLLLQFDTDRDLNVMWGDAGMIYFCIREEDLRAGRFDKVCSTMQCA